MTDLPEMTPSAEEREWAEREAQKLAAISFRQASAIKTMLLATRRAGLDIGAKAERERIVAALREPSESLLFAMHKTGIAPLDLVRVECRTLADYLERQPGLRSAQAEHLACALADVRRAAIEEAMRLCEGPGNQWDAQSRIRALLNRPHKAS